MMPDPMPDVDHAEETQDRRGPDRRIGDWLRSYRATCPPAEDASGCSCIASMDEVHALLDGKDANEVLREYLRGLPHDDGTSADHGPARPQ